MERSVDAESIAELLRRNAPGAPPHPIGRVQWPRSRRVSSCVRRTLAEQEPSYPQGHARRDRAEHVGFGAGAEFVPPSAEFEAGLSDAAAITALASLLTTNVNSGRAHVHGTHGSSFGRAKAGRGCTSDGNRQLRPPKAFRGPPKRVPPPPPFQLEDRHAPTAQRVDSPRPARLARVPRPFQGTVADGFGEGGQLLYRFLRRGNLQAVRDVIAEGEEEASQPSSIRQSSSAAPTKGRHRASRRVWQRCQTSKSAANCRVATTRLGRSLSRIYRISSTYGTRRGLHSQSGPTEVPSTR